MACFSYNRLYPVFQWFGRRISPLWRRFTSMIRPIIGRAFLAIGWRESRNEGKLPDRDCEGQHEEESVAGVRGERTDRRETYRVGPRCEEDEEDEDEDGDCNERTDRRETHRVEPRCEEDEDDEDEDGDCNERTDRRETYRVEPRCEEEDDEDDEDGDFNERTDRRETYRVEPRCEEDEDDEDGDCNERTDRRETRRVEPRCEEDEDDEDDEDGDCNERTDRRETCRVEPRCEEDEDDEDGDCNERTDRRETCRVEPRCEEDEDDEDDDEFDSERYRVETTDEFYCGYDSTWETEENQKNLLGSTRRPASARYHRFSQFERAARDMQNYRHGYPSKYWMRPVSDDKPNLNFYLGKKPSVPDGVYIHDFHHDWAGDYDALEHVHTYIQWLFPLQEPGVNCEASPLSREEVECFLESSAAKDNLLKSYKLMLDFYGIKLCDEETGEVKRALNWEDRFRNLNTHTHNNLRITRILKCQGTLGYPQYQAPLVRFFLEETLVNGELQNVKDSVLNYFVFAVLDKTQRRGLIKFAYLNYDRKDEFVWCPKKIQEMWPRKDGTSF